MSDSSLDDVGDLMAVFSYNRDRKNKLSLYASILLCLVVLLFAYFSFMYVDITNTADNANILIRAIKNGKTLDFYDLTVSQARTNFSANYNFPIYVIFAIWQLPVFYISLKQGVNYLESPVCMLWSKTLVILFAIISAIYIYKIVMHCYGKKERAKMAVLLYFSSGFTFYSIFICCQLEVISTCLMLGGLYYYILGKNRRFYLLFLAAVPFKMFSLFLAVPLLVYREKNIVKLLLSLIFLASPLLIERVVFHGSSIYRFALESQGRDAIEKLMNSQVNIGRPISLFFVLYIGLVIYLYLTKTRNQDVTIYSCFFVWAIFVTLCGINTYWIYLIAPFSILLISNNDKFYKQSVIIESISSLTYIISIACMGTAIFKDRQIATRLFSQCCFKCRDRKY